jgi:iron complex outermembrane receptor protein
MVLESNLLRRFELPRWMGVISLCLAAPGVWSQASAPAADAASDTTLNEVVVTATRRSESVIDTPASISALTSDALKPGGVQNIADLAEEVPNLSVGNQFGVNRTFIRGIGLTSIDLGADGAVAFLQNGAQIPLPAEQLSGFYDLDRVEVLRGPQGTLYGRSATAGVVDMVTKKPTDDVEGYANVTFGNYADKLFEGAIGGPVNDIVSARIAANIEKRDGFGTNLFTGTQIDNRDAQAVRASIRIKPEDKLVIDVIVDYSHENDDNYAFHYFGPTTTTNAGLPAVALFGASTLFNCCGTGNPNLRDIWSSVDPTNKRHGLGATTIVDWSPGDFDVKSITAYRNYNRFNADDLAVSNADIYGRNNYEETSDSWSEDLTVSTKALGIDWLAGLNYFHERRFGSVYVPTTGLGVTLTGGDCTPRVANAAVPCNFLDTGEYLQEGTVISNAYGIFLQGVKVFNDQWSLTLGGRFSHEERSGTGSFIFTALGADIPTDQSADWNAFTPKALLEYHVDPNTLLYASINRGFKSGVINIGSENPVINPEYVWAYETGLKAKGLDDRIQFTAAAFFYDYKDLQVGFVNQQSVVETVNAASAHNYGLETELLARLVPHLQLNVAATYLSAKYTSFVNSYYGANFAPVNVSGNYLDNAPPYTARLGLAYDVPLAGTSGRLLFKAEDSYQGRVYFTEFNNSDATQPGYGLINASAGWESVDKHWNATAWVRNAADKFAIANNIISAPLYANVRVGTVMPPRTFGITLGYQF